MLTERLKKKTNKQTIGLISKKQQLHVQHTSVVLHHYNLELPNYAFYE